MTYALARPAARALLSVLVMTDAIKKADARYAEFASRLLAECAAEEQDIARRNARLTLHRSESTDTDAATVRPSK